MHRLSRLGVSSASLCALSIAVLFAGTALAKGHHHRSRFKGSGTWTVSAPDSNNQYTVSGDLTVNGSTDLTFTGNGQVSSCKDQKTKVCCLTTIVGELQDNSGDTLGFALAGRRCTSDTLDTIKGPIKLQGTGGAFTGLKGAGVLRGQDDPSTGQGPVQVSGAVHG